MLAIIKRFLGDQKGQALPVVLCMLAIGGLTVTGSLNYATTNLKGSSITIESLRAAYAAEAGIENTLWSLLHNAQPSAQLLDNVNQMAVDMETENTGYYTLIFGELLEPGEHNEFVDVTGELVWDDGAGAYRYTITITLQHDSTVHINEIGVRLPDGYSYRAGSAAGFPDNVSNAEPEVTEDETGVFFLRWLFTTPLPSLPPGDPVKTQALYIDGEGVIEDEYAWVVANRTDIGALGTISGNKYAITARAKHPGDSRTYATLEADVIITESKAYIVSWRVVN
ncbi:MAG: hypothetical protein Q8Q07_06110 [Dehalococcoidales bacterium]|nr:hypothetical protein [Dehalococcoidales bacterium]